MSEDGSRRHGAFYGRRKGHRLRSRQAELFETLLPRLAVDVTSPARHLAALFPSPVDDVQLEIGFGGAEHLIGRAEREPRVGFIGAEPFVNGMAKALAAIDEATLTNIRLHPAAAGEVFDRLPAATLGARH